MGLARLIRFQHHVEYRQESISSLSHVRRVVCVGANYVTANFDRTELKGSV